MARAQFDGSITRYVENCRQTAWLRISASNVPITPSNYSCFGSEGNKQKPHCSARTDLPGFGHLPYRFPLRAEASALANSSVTPIRSSLQVISPRAMAASWASELGIRLRISLA